MRKALLAALALAGCSSQALKPEDQAAVERFAAQEQAPAPAPIVASWYAGGEPGFLACAEIKAPPGVGKPTLRLVYDLVRKYGQIEMHEGWHAADGVSGSLLASNRADFDQLWAKQCRS
ncbi:MAG: hypothetical protein V3V60_10500 [Sphingomonas aquatilis]|jgi:hypothetical protein|uniref:hypothetical protein n=1 Tax=Sphingomonas aquatilis TaxID=93063 RepID=UPI002F2D220B